MSSKFQKGDRVALNRIEGTVVKVCGCGKDYTIETTYGDTYNVLENQIVLIQAVDTRSIRGVARRITTTMADLTILAKRIIDADLKNMIKVGWLDNSLQLTAEGEDAVLADYLSENKAKFGKAAEDLLKERRKDRDDR